MAIFAVVSVSIYHQMSAITSTTIRLEEKYYALWVGENVLETYFLEKKWPAIGEDIIEYEMAGREWYVKTEINSGDMDDIRILETSVYKEKSDKSSIVTLYRMIGKN